jgi:hypothetical protein
VNFTETLEAHNTLRPECSFAILLGHSNKLHGAESFLRRYWSDSHTGGSKEFYLLGYNAVQFSLKSTDVSEELSLLCFPPGLILGLFLDPEDGGEMFLRNVNLISNVLHGVILQKIKTLHNSLSFTQEIICSLWNPKHYYCVHKTLS